VGVLRGSELALADGTAARVTIHPSAVLRAGDERAERREELLADLARAAERLRGS
jgi:hypothetical protein